MSVVILFYMIVYFVLALIFVFIVRKITKLGIIRWLAVALVIFLPTWDVVLGYLVYYPACAFIPKIAIYETAETDGIYYEGDFKNYIFKVDDKDEVALACLDLEKGYKYIESLITKESITYSREYKNIMPIVYRCIPLPRNFQKPAYLPIQCMPISNIRSGYVVKMKKLKLGISEMHFMEIKNRTTGILMAEYNEVIRWPYFPFFDWLKWYDSVGTKVISCPEKSHFYDFQYDVLKLKQ